MMIFSIGIIILLIVCQSASQTLYSCNTTTVCGCSSNPALVNRIVGGELERQQEALDDEHREDRRHRPAGPEQAARRIGRCTQQPHHHQARSKSEALQDTPRKSLHSKGADRCGDGHHPALGSGEPEGELHHQRKKERLGALRDPRERTADHGKPERRNLHQ